MHSKMINFTKEMKYSFTKFASFHFNQQINTKIQNNFKLYEKKKLLLFSVSKEMKNG